MAMHNTQCPHCFTTYVISDDQYRVSDGIVRCGTCREQFKASLLRVKVETPKFDPRDVFIEPLSENKAPKDSGDIELAAEPEPSYVSYERSVDPEDDLGFELVSTHEFDSSLINQASSDKVPDDVIAEYANSDKLSTDDIIQNLRNKGVEGIDAPTEELEAQSTHGQLSLQLPEAHSDTSKQAPKGRHAPSLAAQDDLINEVNQLVDTKIIAPSLKPTAKEQPSRLPKKKLEPSLVDDDSDFSLDRKPKRGRRKKNAFVGFIMSSIKLLIVLILLVGLLYQLWLKQLIELPNDQLWFNQAKEFSKPYFDKFEATLNEYGFELPVRRNLSQLELLSAQTEPHPTRSTTVLLKVSIVNRANISQPLPWLEMSLTDADGRLVSRRNLSPQDYIYNNETHARVGANELKKITIELLSFPKTATGYELKLLNK